MMYPTGQKLSFSTSWKPGSTMCWATTWAAPLGYVNYWGPPSWPGSKPMAMNLRAMSTDWSNWSELKDQYLQAGQWPPAGWGFLHRGNEKHQGSHMYSA